MTDMRRLSRHAALVLAVCSIAACADTSPVSPETGAPAAVFSQSSNGATRTEFQVGPNDFITELYLSCIDEVVTLHNLGFVFSYEVVTTPSGNTSTRARISWPENRFFVERQNGVRYYQREGEHSIYREFAGSVHFIMFTDPWHLWSEDGEILKFQAHQQLWFDEEGNLEMYKITGSCP